MKTEYIDGKNCMFGTEFVLTGLIIKIVKESFKNNEAGLFLSVSSRA